jgi:hypothetical protein
MQVFIREVSHQEVKVSKSKDDTSHELENQCISHFPPEHVERAGQSGHVYTLMGVMESSVWTRSHWLQN